MFEPEGGQDLTLSPQTFTNSTEAFINDNSNSLGVPTAVTVTDTDTVGSTEDANVLTDSSKLLIKRARPKASSPNRQGPQQCQEFDRAQPGKVCGKVFGNASALAKHKLTHSDERKYACNVCGKAFKRQDHLNGHMLTHRNKKPYECKADGCGKSYCDARSLRRHTENHHSGANMVVSSTSPTATCIQYAPPPPTQLQRLLSPTPAPAPAASATTTKAPPINDGLTKHQLELIQQIMQQTQKKPGSAISSCSNAISTTSSSISTPSNSCTKHHGTPKTWTVQTNAAELATRDLDTNTTKSDPKPVECNLCHRKFKNVPALNGHMRLHGGYFKKESDAKRFEKKEHSGPPLQTASMSVRALIEEKIIQKRITGGCGLTQNTLTYSISTIHNHGGDKPNLSRRHSDVQRIGPCTATGPAHKQGVRRASSDPGSLQLHSRQLVINDQREALCPEVNGYMFKQVQSVEDTMLLQEVDHKQLNDSMQVATLQNIESLDDCQGTFQGHKYQQQQDIQSALAPLPCNIANFGFSNNQSSLIKDFQSSESSQNQASQSPSVLMYPPACSSQGQSPSFEPRHSVSLNRTSPLTSTFYHSNISSSAFEGSFNDTNPLGSVQSAYPQTQSPLSAIPISSSLSLPNNPSSPIPEHTLQSQMMPNSDDPLLSSSPKDFACKKRFDFQTIKFLNNGTVNIGSSSGSTQEVTGVVVDRNGELKLIHTAYNFQPINSSSLSNVTETVYVNTRPILKSDSVDKTKEDTQDTVLNKVHEINNVQLIEHIKEAIIDDGDVFLNPSSLSSNHNIGSAVITKKRLRPDIIQQPYHSKLRTLIVQQSTILPLPYTPPPMLLPSRNGHGLYWQAISRCPSSTTIKGELSDDNFDELSDGAPESDVSPHINIGHQFQCSVPVWMETLSPNANSDSFHEHLLWDPGISTFTTESEVEMYLEFACCAAVPGGGRNKEYALHLLHLCHGNIHDAMLKLMQPTPLLPPDHSLISFEYTDCDRWSDDEIDSFHKGLLKFDKDFTSIANEVGTKNAKQCVQFYYMWKKICPEDYKRIRLGRRRNKESDYEFECIKSDISVNDWDMVSTSSESRLFVCEYPDCSASFNSRAALNGHIRIHGGGVCARSPTPDKRLIGTPTHLSHSDAIEEFPCKICGKVFNKVKSRSAHMKSHRPPDAEPKKAKQLDISVTVSSTVARHL